MSFVEGELYERTIETPAGRIDVLAEIFLHGHQLELRDIAVYPSGTERLAVPPSELLTWARLALGEIAEQGFEELRVTGTRLSGARPGRRVDLVIRLRREQP
jgi:hypothetical protein